MSESQLDIQASFERIEKMQILHHEICQIEKEKGNSEAAIPRIQEIILESSALEEKSSTPVEKILDAKILHTGTNYINSSVKSFSTNLTQIDEATYVKGVLSFVENSNLGIGWDCLASITYPMFKKCHPVNFMLGTFSFEPPPIKEKVKVERQKKAPVHEKKVLETVVEEAKDEEEGTTVYTHILMCLKNCYKKNDKKPVSYFNFIIDPTSYWRTIENIFHFAFLVHDGCVKMSIKNDLPYVVPVFKKKLVEDEDKAEENYHFCFSLSVPEWEECIRKFDVQSASISPFVKNK